MSAPEFSLVTGSAATAEADALIVGLRTGEDGPVLAGGAEDVDAAFDGTLLELLTLAGASGKADDVVKFPTRGAVSAPLLVGVGLGRAQADAPAGAEAEQVRRASGAAARALAGTGRVASTLSRLDLAAATEGSLLGAYAFTTYKTNGAGKEPVAQFDLLVDKSDDDTTAALARAVAVAGAVRTARNLINTPPNDLFPASFADRAADIGAGAGLEVEVLDERQLADAGYGGVLGVGSGSSRPPRLVRLRWSGGDSPRASVALVGKGITFDTGGISIKPAANMDHMTSDMSGAAAVIATVALAAELKLPVTVTATVPMAENMPSGTSYRPGDVLTMYGGKTVEVLNTDAEGRLVLADAMVRAAEDSPDYLIETSTLTGAQLVALGTRTAGVMGTDEFRDRVAAVAKATGEGGWAMPLPEELRGDLDSRLADLANVTGHRWGGMLSAGLFLREFVADGLPWVHIDIAGPSFNTGGPWGYTPKGGTGVPVRTLAALLTDIAENG
ncbi:MAG TPA: leucyl aminopeptidase [Pseudonocardia sp.]|uniref:leucyl aminopeptidase n=1 Tax=Pseudonocardia sp. TaxID=60912 RepID=UPI002C58F2A9|nr:leucyl aminopeptidase [Pseudonocardia sp.]HTF46890.1 leucyl aminopeptidase [Pseudonocardia sp.]